MKRRDFITLLGGAVAWPVAASAQEKGRIYRLGSLFGAPRGAPFHIAFFEGLQRFGFIEGQNLVADPDGYGLRAEQLADHASEVVSKAELTSSFAPGMQPFTPHSRRRKLFRFLRQRTT
jgi:putative tryptophan/tyrosine transport system substrate-binding protein